MVNHSVRNEERNPCGFILIFILSPSHEFLFSIMMSYHGGLSTSTDNKLHICDNHLGENGLGKV